MNIENSNEFQQHKHYDAVCNRNGFKNLLPFWIAQVVTYDVKNPDGKRRL